MKRSRILLLILPGIKNPSFALSLRLLLFRHTIPLDFALGCEISPLHKLLGSDKIPLVVFKMYAQSCPSSCPSVYLPNPM